MKLKNKDDGTVAGYRFLILWWTVAVTERIWEAVVNYVTSPTWWRGIWSVEVLPCGDESGSFPHPYRLLASQKASRGSIP